MDRPTSRRRIPLSPRRLLDPTSSVPHGLVSFVVQFLREAVGEDARALAELVLPTSPLLAAFDRAFELDRVDLGSALLLADEQKLYHRLASSRDFAAAYEWVRARADEISEAAYLAKRANGLLLDALGAQPHPLVEQHTLRAVRDLCLELGGVSEPLAREALFARWRALAPAMWDRLLVLRRIDHTLQTLDQQLRRIFDRCTVLRGLARDREDPRPMGEREDDLAGDLSLRVQLLARLYYPCYHVPSPAYALVLDWELRHDRPFETMEPDEARRVFGDMFPTDGRAALPLVAAS